MLRILLIGIVVVQFSPSLFAFLSRLVDGWPCFGRLVFPGRVTVQFGDDFGQPVFCWLPLRELKDVGRFPPFCERVLVFLLWLFGGFLGALRFFVSFFFHLFLFCFVT